MESNTIITTNINVLNETFISAYLFRYSWKTMECYYLNKCMI